MDRVWESGAVSTPPTVPASLSIGYPTDDAPSTNPGAWWYHMVTEELRNVVAVAGMAPSGNTTTQIAQAIALIAKQSVSSGTFAPVRVVDTTGVTMRYTQTVDGVALVNGDRVLRAVGTDANNGIWIVSSSGVWTRSIDYGAGAVVPEGMTVEVAEGTVNAGTMWQLQPVPGELITVGATTVSFSNINGTLNAIFSKYLLITTASTTYAPLTSPSFAGSVTLTNYNQNAVPYINSVNVLTSSTSLGFDGTNLTVAGGVTSGKVNVTGSTLPTNGLYLPSANALGFTTNGAIQATLTSLGYFGIGATPLYQGQYTGAGQATSAYSDSGNVGASLFLQDTVATAGSGGALLFGTTLGRAQSFAAIKGLLTDTTGGKLGNLAVSLRRNSGDTSLTEVGRYTSYGNFLLGLTVDPLAANTGSIVAQNYVYSAQSIATSAGSNGQFLAVGGSGSAWYGAYLRNDGTNGYLGTTAVASSQAGVLGSSSANLQPFFWNLATGAVTIDGTGAGVTFGGAVNGISPPVGDSSNKLTTSSWVKSAISTAVSGLSGGGTGGLTSIAVTVPSFLSVANSTINSATPTLTIGLGMGALPLAAGGTGGTSQATAMAALGAYSMSDMTYQIVAPSTYNGTYYNTLSFNAPSNGRVIAIGILDTTIAYSSSTNTGSAASMGHGISFNGGSNTGSSVTVSGSSTIFRTQYVLSGTAMSISQSGTYLTPGYGSPFLIELLYIFVPATS